MEDTFMVNENIRTVRGLLDAAADAYGEKPFIRFLQNGEVSERSFARVREHSLAFCRMLRANYPAGAHVAVAAGSSYETVIAMCGCFAGGFVLIPMAPETGAAEAAVLLRDADADVLLYGPGYGERAAFLAAELPGLKHTRELPGGDAFEALLAPYGEGGAYGALSAVETDPYALAVLIYTSGTTGEPKGVMLSNFALMENVMYKAFNKDTEREDDVRLSVLPLHHVFCFVSDFLSSLKMGNTLCLNGAVRELFGNLLRYRPTAMRIVPQLAAGILNRIKAVQARTPELTPAEAAAKVTGGRLRWMLCGGAYLPPEYTE